MKLKLVNRRIGGGIVQTVLVVEKGGEEYLLPTLNIRHDQEPDESPKVLIELCHVTYEGDCLTWDMMELEN
jgi:hypothetical protein